MAKNFAPLPGDEKVRKTINRPYSSPLSLHRAMKNYFDKCAGEGEGIGTPPTVAGMRIFLKLNHDSYNSYRDDPEYTAVFEWAQDMREDWYQTAMLLDPKMTSACMNALKQPENGGWVDRRADTGDKTLRVITAGVGGEEAFR